MKINNLIFIDKSRQWGLENISFDKLTLLVGASGVGKTQILKAILSLKNVANGRPINGIKWNVEFETASGKKYSWEGEYEDKGIQAFTDPEDEETKKNNPKILKEKVSLNGKEIIKRNSKETIFSGKKTLKLSPQQSIISILKEEDLVKPIYLGFKKMIFSDQSDSQKEPFKISLFNVSKLLKLHNTLKKIQESDEDIRVKLYLVSKLNVNTFSIIKERFIEIFPQVEDLKIEPLELDDDNLPTYFKDYPFIQIKENGIDKWILQGYISSGMFRTLMQISETYLCSDGTIFLIDEFENSLGINCIDELTSDILKTNRQLQFIITSHHPYIINNIHYSNWKLVTRKAGVVRTHNASKFNIGKSKHDAFMQLMQLEEYQTGLE